MKKTKTFDCVEMKQAIQKEIETETRGMTEEEMRIFYRKRLKSHKIFQKFMQEPHEKPGIPSPAQRKKAI